MINLTDSYFMNYEKIFGRTVMEFAQKKLTEEWINSAGGKIHLDILVNDVASPTIVFSHGICGYGRLLVPFANKLYKNGFNVILPDLIGYGHNKGKRGHWKWNELVYNLIDSCNYAKKKFNSNVFLAGGSMGGSLAYHAVCHGAPVRALASYCLYDFQDVELIKELSSFGRFTSLAILSLRQLSRIAPNFSISVARVISSYDNLSDNTEFNNLVKNDPLGCNKMTLTATTEMMGIVLPIPFEKYNIVPILVIQPGADKMISGKFSKRAYNRLGIKEKKYVEVEGRGHWIIDDEGVDLICSEITKWFLKIN